MFEAWANNRREYAIAPNMRSILLLSPLCWLCLKSNLKPVAQCASSESRRFWGAGIAKHGAAYIIEGVSVGKSPIATGNRVD